MQLLIATTNINKLREYNYIFAGSDLELTSLANYPEVSAPEENANTYKENALIKAEYYFEKFKQPLLVDDSGLSIDDLDGKPGVHSARMLSVYNKDGNFTELKNLLHTRSPGKKEFAARFTCHIIYKDQRKTEHFNAYREGKVVFPPRGTNKHAFGYNPIFVAEGLTITVAEMDIETKLKYSPRALAGKQARLSLNLKS